MGKPSSGWDRDQVTVRLTSARKDLLMTLAANELVCGSPCDAIDRALEIAANGAATARHLTERMGSLEEAFAAAESARSDEASRVETTLAQIARSLSDLHELIASLAESEN